MVDLDDVKAAQKRIEKTILRTPCVPSIALSQALGVDIRLKLENLQFVGSFKERGAANKIALLTPQERQRGIIAVSAGNHAQGVARHAQLEGIEATIVMPKSTPINKIIQTKQWGARVLLEGNNFEQSVLFARDLQQKEHLTFVHPYDDEAVIAGQGTCALEIFEDFPDLDAIATPIGGGGLLSGTAIVARAANPNIKIYGVQVASHNSLENFPGAEITPSGKTTLAEGIAVHKIGDLTREIIKHFVDAVLVVSETDIEDAITLLTEKAKQVAEGAGAAAVAAVMRHPEYFKGRKTAVPISGGNIDTRMLSQTLTRSLYRHQKLNQIELEIPDKAGVLEDILAIISQNDGKLLEMNTPQTAPKTYSVKLRHVSLVFEVPDKKQAVQIQKELKKHYHIL